MEHQRRLSGVSMPIVRISRHRGCNLSRQLVPVDDADAESPLCANLVGCDFQRRGVPDMRIDDEELPKPARAYPGRELENDRDQEPRRERECSRPLVGTLAAPTACRSSLRR